MNIVLLSTSRRLSPALIDAARAKTDSGLPVDVVSYAPAQEPLEAGVRTHVVTGDHSRPITLPAKVMHRLWRTKPGRAARRLTKGGVSRRMWSATRRNTDAARLLERADVVIALDTAAIRTAWHVARRNRRAVVVYGAAAAAHRLRDLDARSATASAS